MMAVYWLALLLLVVYFQPLNGEVFTAIADMEGLVQTEMALAQSLQMVIQTEENRIKQLKGYLREFTSMYEEANNDITKYLANPINAYLLVKRLTADLSDMESIMIKSPYPEYSLNVTKLRQLLTFPTNEDLNGAAVALTRLQDMYLLETPALADGILQGKKYSRQLTAGDCFELGRQLYNNYDYVHTVLWMKEALKKEAQEETKTASRIEILEYLEFSTFKLGNLEEAIAFADAVLAVDPNHQRVKENKENYQQVLRQQEDAGQNEDYDDDDDSIVDATLAGVGSNTNYVDPDDELYNALCRGEKLLDPEIERQLRCRYVTKGNPFLFLQPAKEEEALLSPRIVIYHDVINDDEISFVKRQAQPRFERASVLVHLTGQKMPAPFRIAKSSFIDDIEHPQIAKISRRIGLISGLDMRTSESLQVVNYGIGGQYEPHHDHAIKEKPNLYSPLGQDWGNRMATWLYYMTDVEAGGATVFPRLNVALWPRKGSAALWYNLLPSGEGDDRTRHASCPVLTGSKWVCNKWIHERGQEFRRPCRIHPDVDV